MAERYLAHVAATVKLLGRYGIYTLLDMHQDVYNTNFRGEGAPNWAVCTTIVPIVPTAGRWSNNYANPELQTAIQHFWANDVVGDLQGNFDLVWATVADYSKNDRGVVGSDPSTSPSRRKRRWRPSRPSQVNWRAFTPGRATPASSPTGPLAGVPIGCAERRAHPDVPGRRPEPPDLRGPDIYWVSGGNIPSEFGTYNAPIILKLA